jgi:predicted amidohydrolase YtcJ
MKQSAMLMTCALLLCSTHAAFTQYADLVFTGGRVWTVDAALPEAEAVAVRGDTIMAVGKDAAVRSLIGPRTTVVPLHGRLMLPGFIDDHTHFLSGGFQLQSIDLRYAKDEAEFAARIGQRAKAYPDRWVTGGDWDHDNWPGGKLPAKTLVDKVTPNTPVFVSRYDGHMALVNSLVLRRAKITHDTPDPHGGAIVRDPATGEPTGILKDEAMSLVYGLIPDPTEEEFFEAARLALAEARRNGLTSIQDVSTDAHVRIYTALRDRGELTARMNCRLPIGMVDELAHRNLKAHTGDRWVRTGSLKAFADGSLGSSTALFFEPYVSEPTTRGLASDVLLDGRLEKWAMTGDRAHLQLSIHAIGDSANSRMLDLFEQIVKETPAWDRRFRIEHAQHIHPKDFDRFARLHAIASAQPYHAIDDGRWAEGRIGHERCKTTYPFRTFIDRGVTLCFGSDWTVAPLNPLLGIDAAVTRRTTDGKHPEGWFPEQRITVQEAIKAYTLNNAYAAFEEDEKGSITRGKLADLVVLSDDIISCDPNRIVDAQVVMTVVGGKIVYETKGETKR